MKQLTSSLALRFLKLLAFGIVERLLYDHSLFARLELVWFFWRRHFTLPLGGSKTSLRVFGEASPGSGRPFPAVRFSRPTLPGGG